MLRGGAREGAADVGPGGVFEVDLLHQRVALLMALISPECCGRGGRENIRKCWIYNSKPALFGPGEHQWSLGAVSQRRGGSAEPVHPHGAEGQCCAQK